MRIPALLDALGQRFIPDPQRRAIAYKAVNFALVGVINAAVDFSVFSFAYYYLGLPIITSNIISWLVAVTGSYIMNSMTTFAVEVRPQAALAGLMQASCWRSWPASSPIRRPCSWPP